MMKVYFGFDDTDTLDSQFGTGKLVRWFQGAMITNGWIRPRLLGHLPVLFVSPQGKGQWKNIYWKREKDNHLEKQKQIKL